MRIAKIRIARIRIAKKIGIINKRIQWNGIEWNRVRMELEWNRIGLNKIGRKYKNKNQRRLRIEKKTIE